LDFVALQDRAVFHNLAFAEVCTLNAVVVTARGDISNSWWQTNNVKTFSEYLFLGVGAHAPLAVILLSPSGSASDCYKYVVYLVLLIDKYLYFRQRLRALHKVYKCTYSKLLEKEIKGGGSRLTWVHVENGH